MLIHFTFEEILLPDFLIVGAMRSGTTSLYNYLVRHPSIYMPNLKEPQFFSYYGETYSPHPPHIRAEPWNLIDYCKLFQGAKPGQVIGEASTSYLYRYHETVENIRLIYGSNAKNIKIIGVLRNPIERAWSIYMLKRQGGDWDQPFFSIAKEFQKSENRSQYYNFIESGKYSKQVSYFQNFFPKTKFFLFEEFTMNPSRVVKEILSFLDIKNLLIPSNVGKVYNYSGVPLSKAIAPIYNFLFQKNKIKKALKPLMPEKYRIAIKAAIGKMISKKKMIPDYEKAYLSSVFLEDIKMLSNVIKNSRQKAIIEKWLDSIQ